MLINPLSSDDDVYSLHFDPVACVVALLGTGNALSGSFQSNLERLFGWENQNWALFSLMPAVLCAFGEEQFKFRHHICSQ